MFAWLLPFSRGRNPAGSAVGAGTFVMRATAGWRARGLSCSWRPYQGQQWATTTQRSVELYHCPIFRMGSGVCRYPLVPAQSPVVPLSTVTVDGTMYAARGGNSLSVASGDPSRASGSCRQRNFCGHSVGKAKVPDPQPLQVTSALSRRWSRALHSYSS